MAFFDSHFFSETLGLMSSAYVILPQRPKESTAEAQPFQTLWLLHGFSDDHTVWLRRTSIERYAAEHGVAVVMPAIDHSFYTDMVHGKKYFTYVSEELPAILRSFFPLSAAREDNFVAGLSMGGYGAFKLALSLPENYAAAASLSGAVDMADASRGEDDEYWMELMRNIYGSPEAVPNSPNCLFYLAEQVAKSGGPQPMLYSWCGTEDFLYTHNMRFRDHAEKVGLELDYREGPGDHQWKYWDEQIQKVLSWLPLRKAEPGI
jgi:S-formylglutathione hydrolase FrmB